MTPRPRYEPGYVLIDEVENERQFAEYRKAHPLPETLGLTVENMTRLPRDYTEPPRMKPYEERKGHG